MEEIYPKCKICGNCSDCCGCPKCKIESCKGKDCLPHCPCDCHKPCVCGVPTTKDVIHRKDAPCYYDFMKDEKLNECCEKCEHFDYCTPKTCICHKVVFEFPHCCLIHKGTLSKTCDKCAYENEIKVYIYEFLKRERKDTLQAVKELVEGMVVNTPDEVAELNKGLPNPLAEYAYNNAVGYCKAVEDIKVKLDELISK